MTGKKRTGRNILLAAAVTLGISGCSLAPSFLRPDVSLEDVWVGTALEAQQEAGSHVARDLGWRDYFRDPQLRQFIALALENNHDLKTAALNAELARAQYRITRSDRLPAVDGTASATRKRTAEDLSYYGTASTDNAFTAGLDITSYELDFFSRVKNASDAKLNAYLGTLEARDAAQLSIISAVSKAYYEMRIAHRLMMLAEDVRKTREDAWNLTKLQVDAGTASETTLQGMRSAIELARADYQAQKRASIQARNTLSTLIGQPVTRLKLENALSLRDQFPEQPLVAGLPSEVLLARPDIREAEYALKAANANIGAARAAYFPSISLVGSVGYATTDLDNLFDSDNGTWTFGPRLNLPIFNYGKLRANVEVMKVNEKIAVESYAKAIQNAFADIDNALAGRETLEKQVRATIRSDEAVAKRLYLVDMQMREGIVDGLTLLDAERESFTSRQNVLRTGQLILNNNVELYVALGGGLKEFTIDKQPAPQSEKPMKEPAL